MLHSFNLISEYTFHTRVINYISLNKHEKCLRKNLQFQIMNRKTSLCLRKPIGHGSLNQPSGSAILVPCSEEPQLQLMFVMTQDGVIATDESVCLEAPEHDHSTDQPKTRIVACSGLSRQRWRFNARVRKINLKKYFHSSNLFVILYMIDFYFCVYICM